MDHSLLLVGISIIFETPVCLATLPVTPVNKFVQVGDSTELSCRTDLTKSVTWMQKNLTDSRSYLLYTAHHIKDSPTRIRSDRFSVIRSSVSDGWYNLTIKNVSFDDAGVYTCVDDDNAEGAQRQSLELVVIDNGGLRCTHNLDICDRSSPLDNINITCRLGYRSNIAPTLVWKMNDTVVVSDHNNTVVSSHSETTVAMSIASISIRMRPSQLISRSRLMCEVLNTQSTKDLRIPPSTNELVLHHKVSADTACLPINKMCYREESADLGCSTGSFYWPNVNNALQFNLEVYHANTYLFTRFYYCEEVKMPVICVHSLFSFVQEVSVRSRIIVLAATVIPILLLLCCGIIIGIVYCVKKSRAN